MNRKLLSLLVGELAATNRHDEIVELIVAPADDVKNRLNSHISVVQSRIKKTIGDAEQMLKDIEGD